ncbi:TPA: hypothetical protein HA242_07525 [Candidatus Woesearchaeota archaeon]|nr:hypothetical protein [Candidatus Woesearchaeota archaeon]HIH13546.1 hypothetical protein [Candidatus Woesearchaeota archaeon]
MDKFAAAVITRFREYRSEKLKPLAEVCLHLGLNANYVTALSLLAGLLAVYFVFQSYLLFLLFALLHLFFDSLDGVVASIPGKTTGGAYFDVGTDTFISFLLLLKVGWFLQDYYVYIIAGLFFLAAVIHFLSCLEAPLLFTRTVGIAILSIATFPAFPWIQELLTIGYLAAGIASVFSLARQLQWKMMKRTG